MPLIDKKAKTNWSYLTITLLWGVVNAMVILQNSAIPA